ncbi:hypothetical protein O3P69_020201 [Scylla paramamosain]|uniref:Protein kinase domain-containing protein n=1 Tax=Scylla paramamosain TaxID=85552 RepID=A0AAW0TNA8_SCYPA
MTLSRVYMGSKRMLHEGTVALQQCGGLVSGTCTPGVSTCSSTRIQGAECEAKQGISVVELRRRGEVRLCLTALLHLCDIVSAMHERRVIHRDLHGGNILVSFKDTDSGVDVWVVDFGEAVMCAGGEALKVDEAQVMMLVRDTLRDVRQGSDRDIIRRRRNLLTSLTTNSLGLHQISSMIRTVLRGTHSGTGAIQSPTL